MKRADAFEIVLNELENPGPKKDREFAIKALRVICDDVDELLRTIKGGSMASGPSSTTSKETT
jgi:hypothetical protein